MTSNQRSRKFDPRGIRSRFRALHRPQLEILEDRMLLATCQVTNNTDHDSGSLRLCMTSSFNEITFSGSFNIQLQSALPVISWDLLIDGPGPANLTVQGEGDTDPYRIFEISSHTVTIRDLTISDGWADSGGGIKNAGTLTLTNVIVENNVAAQFDNTDREIYGGGVWSSGSLTVTGASEIRNNKVMGSEGCSPLFEEPPEDEGEGGELDNPFVVCPDIFGGGGIYLAPDSEGDITGGSFIESNIVCHPDDPCDGSISIPLNDSTTFYGGGIYVHNAELHLQESTIQLNEVHARSPVDDHSFRGQGGGIQADCYGDAAICLLIESSTIAGNVVSLTGSLADAGITASAHGGAISTAGPEATPKREVQIINSTIANNTMSNEVTGSGCPAPPTLGACKTGGSALWFKGMLVEIRWATIASNSADGNGVIEGGGILASNVPPSELILRSTLFDDNTADGAESSLVLTNFDMTSEGRNLFGDDPNEGEIMTDQVNKEVCFLTLGGQGGLTDTLELAKCGSTTSPAIDLGGDPDNGLDFDQRGDSFDREFGSHTDVGAFECQDGECEQTGSIPPPPDDGFGQNSWGVSNESGSFFDQDRGASMPAEESTAPVKPAVVFGGSVSRTLPIKADTNALWNDALLMLGEHAPEAALLS